MSERKGSQNSDVLLSVEGLMKRFAVPGGKTVYAVEDVSFEIKRGTTVGLVGESGSGKTTAGRTLLRLIEPSGGKAIFDGVDIFALSEREFKEYRKRIQIIFQDPYSSLNPRMRVHAIISEALDLRGFAKGDARKERIAELMTLVGLRPEYASRYPHEFSGGQRQRIGIARALAVEPDFVVADEPVSALDVSVQAQVLNLLRDLQKRLGLTLLFIAHDLSVVEYLCDDVVVMYLGRIMERGPARDVYSNPRHPYTKALLAMAPIPDPDYVREKITLFGDIPSPIAPPSGCVFRTRCPYAIDECAKTIPQTKHVGQEHYVACIRQQELFVSV